MTIAQSAPDRRVTIIGDVSYVVEGPRVRTCSDSSDDCEDVIDAARTSDVQLGPDFYGTSATARLRTAAAAATGPATASTEQIEDQAATCASIPLPGDTTVVCAFDNGVLARLDASDVDLTMTSVLRRGRRVALAVTRRSSGQESSSFCLCAWNSSSVSVPRSRIASSRSSWLASVATGRGAPWRCRACAPR